MANQKKRLTLKQMTVLRDALKDIRNAATMSNASFNRIGLDAGEGLPKTEEEVTRFIMDRTHLFRYSWIVHPLEAALTLLETALGEEPSPAPDPKTNPRYTLNDRNVC